LALNFAIVPRHVLGGAGFVAPSDRVNVAGIGAGGMGGGDIATVSRLGATIVALCDVDDERAAGSYRAFPKARRYKDFRKMLDAEVNRIDAVTVGTPDHIHAVASRAAIRAGKHVYCQKPLTHDVWEARKMAEVARAKKVVTQMGIQVHSSREYRLAVKVIQDGAIGKVKEVHSWSNKKWGYDGKRPEGEDPVPANLDWDLWLATAPDRPFKKGLYHPGNWRKWTDFGCGTMGDMSIHILDPIAGALELTQPKTILSESDVPPAESFANKNKVKYVSGHEVHRRSVPAHGTTATPRPPRAGGWTSAGPGVGVRGRETCCSRTSPSRSFPRSPSRTTMPEVAARTTGTMGERLQGRRDDVGQPRLRRSLTEFVLRA
jgi:hypothetical protein